MFKNLTDILTADCEVIKFNDEQFFYPIFKNGRSSLKKYAERKNLPLLKNKKISNLKKNNNIFKIAKRKICVGGVYFFLSHK